MGELIYAIAVQPGLHSFVTITPGASQPVGQVGKGAVFRRALALHVIQVLTLGGLVGPTALDPCCRRGRTSGTAPCGPDVTLVDHTQLRLGHAVVPPPLRVSPSGGRPAEPERS